MSGRACDVCSEGSYNLRSANPDGCDDCGCDVSGTVNGSVACHKVTGQCSCKRNVRSKLLADVIESYQTERIRSMSQGHRAV